MLIPDDATSAQDALRLADQRMYRPRAAGARRRGVRAPTCCSRSCPSATPTSTRTCPTCRCWRARRRRRLGLSEREQELTALAAELHDVGKVAIPDAILEKPGPLDDAEWSFMRRHTVVGERIIEAAPALTDVAPIVRASHERMDGNGYPDRRKGDEIPLPARIVAVCDAYDAMRSRRAYKEPLSIGEALAELQRCAGTQFDADIVRVFSELASEREHVEDGVGR